MNLKFTNIIILIIFLSIHAYCQDTVKKNSFTYRPVINQLSVAYERAITPRFSLSFEPGYVYNILSTYYYKGNLFDWGYCQILAFNGYSLKFNINFFNKNKTEYFQIAFLNQNLSSKKIIWDEGYFAGNVTGEYSEYTQKNKDYAVQLFNYQKIKNCSTWIFIGIGAKLRYYDIQYSINGTGEHKNPSNETVSKHFIKPILNIGIRVTLFKF